MHQGTCSRLIFTGWVSYLCPGTEQEHPNAVLCPCVYPTMMPLWKGSIPYNVINTSCLLLWQSTLHDMCVYHHHHSYWMKIILFSWSQHNNEIITYNYTITFKCTLYITCMGLDREVNINSIWVYIFWSFVPLPEHFLTQSPCSTGLQYHTLKIPFPVAGFLVFFSIFRTALDLDMFKQSGICS